MYCLQCFSKDVLERHKSNSIVINENKLSRCLKKNNNILKFDNFHKQLPVPYVIYADFEVITEKIQTCTKKK